MTLKNSIIQKFQWGNQIFDGFKVTKVKGVYEFINAAKILKRKGLEINFQLVGKPDKSNPLAISKSEIHKWVSRVL